jgi:EmrB/QacA subfamily drug resistance transporter
MGIPKNKIPTLAVLLVGAFLASLSQTVLTTALPKIIAEFSITASTGQWVTTMYMLIMGVMIPVSAYILGRFTTRQIYLVCMGGLLLGSAFAFFAPSFPVLLLGRFLQAAGAGLFLPLIQVALMACVPRDSQGTAMGLVGLIVGFAPALGPLVSGMLTDAFGWRSIFAMIGIGAAVLLILAALLVRNMGCKDSAAFDIPSVCLSSLGFLGLLFGISSISSHHFFSLYVLFPLLLGIAALMCFVYRQFSLGHPLLELRVFQYRDFAVGAAILILVTANMMGPGLILPIYIQTYRGYSALASGLVMLPGALFYCAANLIAGKLMDRHGMRMISLFGAVMLIVGTGALIFLGTDTPMLYLVVVYTFRYIGLACLYTPATAWGLGALRKEEVPHGSAILNTLSQVGNAIGSALMVTIMSVTTASVSAGTELEAGIHGVDMSFIFAVCLGAIILLLLLIFAKRAQNAIR